LEGKPVSEISEEDVPEISTSSSEEFSSYSSEEESSEEEKSGEAKSESRSGLLLDIRQSADKIDNLKKSVQSTFAKSEKNTKKGKKRKNKIELSNPLDSDHEEFEGGDEEGSELIPKRRKKKMK